MKLRRSFFVLLVLPGLALAAGVALAQSRPDPARQAHDLVKQGRIEQALPLFRQALERDPGDTATCSEYATVLCNSGQRPEGMAAVEGCLQRRPRESSLYLARGACHQGRGPDGFAAAAADYRQAIALAPNSAAAHNQLGLILQAQGDHQRAIAEFQAAMDADPNMLIAWNNKAASLIALGRYPEAIALLQSAISRAENLKGLYFYTSLGNAFMHAGMPGQAEAAYLMETAINPDHLVAHLNLGNLYVLRGRYPEAIYEYKFILISDPKNRDVLINLGAACIMAGNPDEAQGYLRQAVSLYPDSPLAHHYLSLAYRDLGELEKAVTEEKIAVNLGYRPAQPAPAPGTSPPTAP